MTTNWKNLLVTLPLLGACIDDPELAEMDQDIINGDAIAPANSGIVQINNLSSGCSGLLLDNTWVLTASHCIDSYKDHSFDADGSAVITFAGQQGAHARAVAVDQYGRAVLAGSVWDGTRSRFAVARVGANGSTDPYFNSGAGRVVTALGNSAVASAVAIDAQQRIVVGGWVDNSGRRQLALVRYTTSGAIDGSFGYLGGITLANPAQSTDEEITGIALDSQGRIVVSGLATVAGRSQFLAARFTPNGLLDTSFAGDGIAITDFASTANEFARSVAVDSLDRVIIGGRADDQIALARYRTDGSLDTSFDGDGKVLAQYGGKSSSAAALAVDGQNRIVITGETSSLNGMLVGRFTTSGALDATFDGNGWTSITPVLDYSSARGTAVTIDSKNRVVVAGIAIDHNGYPRWAAGRLSQTGAQDKIFNTNAGLVGGFATNSSTTYAVLTTGVAVDANDNIVLSMETDNTALGVARLLAVSDAVNAWPGLTVMMGNQTVNASRVFRAPGYDAGLIKLASPLAMNGSYTGYQARPFYTTSPSNLVGHGVDVYGYGYNSFDGTGFGTLRTAHLDVTSATTQEYTMSTNDDDQIVYKGDSGGPTFVYATNGWYIAGLHSWGNGSTSTDVAANYFAPWVAFIRQYN